MIVLIMFLVIKLTVNMLILCRCAAPNCEVDFPPGLIKSCVGDEAYAKYDSIMLQVTTNIQGQIQNI